MLEWVVISFHFPPDLGIQPVSCIAGGFFTIEPRGKPPYFHFIGIQLIYNGVLISGA